MNTRRHGVSRRRSTVMAGAVAVLLASGGAAAANSGSDAASTNTDVTLTKLSGPHSHPHFVPLDTQLNEVPGAQEPHNVQPGHATPLEDALIVVGDEGDTQARP